MGYFDKYLLDCNVTVHDAALTHCWADWKDTDYVPPCNKFYFILHGEGALTVGGKEFFPRSGELALMPSGIIQSYRTNPERPYTKYWCHFSAKVQDVNLFDLIEVPYMVRVSNIPYLSSLFQQMIDCYRDERVTNRLRGKAFMLEILAYFLEEVGTENIHASEQLPSDKLFSITNYIAAHLGEEITLEELASLVHFHPNYFIHFFKQYFGVAPLKYVANARLERAKLLLKNTEYNIAEIAAQTGYRDLFYFSKRFKEQTGFSPSDFRKL